MFRLVILLVCGLFLSNCAMIRNWDTGENFIKDDKNFDINTLTKKNKSVATFHISTRFVLQNINNQIYDSRDDDVMYCGGVNIFPLPAGHYFISNGILVDAESGTPPLAKSLFTVGAATLTEVFTWYDLLKIPGVYHFEVKPGEVKYFGSVGADVVHDSENRYAWTGLVVSDEFDYLQKSLTRYSKKYDNFKNRLQKDTMKLSPLPPRCMFYEMIKDGVKDERYKTIYPKTPENIKTCLNDLKELFEGRGIGKMRKV